MPTNVYIVEDHPLLQRMLSEFIMHLSDLNVCGVAAYGKDALMQIPKSKVDLLLLDLCLPDMTGFKLISELTPLLPDLPVLILSTYNEPIYIQRALAAGARGYIVKGDPYEVETAIRQVLAGEIYLSL